jgi:hypothetical protein
MELTAEAFRSKVSECGNEYEGPSLSSKISRGTEIFSWLEFARAPLPF